MKPSRFFLELNQLIDKMVELETSYGSIRRGKITGFTYRDLKFINRDGESTVEIITEIELNGDPSDRMTLSELCRIERI